MNTLPPSSDYPFDAEAPHSLSYLRGPVLAALRGAGVRRVIDLGCGNGGMARELVDAGMEVVGIDPSASGIEACRRRVPEGTFYRMGLADDARALGAMRFDAAISTEVVEHLYSPRALPRFARSVLRAGAPLLVTTPYHGYLKNLALSLAGGWDGHHSPMWDGGHIKFWSRATLTHLLEEEGFAVQRFEGCGRVPFLWKSMLLMATLRPGAGA